MEREKRVDGPDYQQDLAAHTLAVKSRDDPGKRCSQKEHLSHGVGGDSRLHRTEEALPQTVAGVTEERVKDRVNIQVSRSPLCLHQLILRIRREDPGPIAEEER